MATVATKSIIRRKRNNLTDNERPRDIISETGNAHM